MAPVCPTCGSAKTVRAHSLPLGCFTCSDCDAVFRVTRNCARCGMPLNAEGDCSANPVAHRFALPGLMPDEEFLRYLRRVDMSRPLLSTRASPTAAMVEWIGYAQRTLRDWSDDDTTAAMQSHLLIASECCRLANEQLAAYARLRALEEQTDEQGGA